MVAASKENRITCGLNELRLGLESHEVEAVRQSFGDVLNVGKSAVAFVDGRIVGGDYRLGRGEALELYPMSGSKGALEPEELARPEPVDQCLHPSAPNVLQINHDTLTVTYGEKTCFLGNGKHFRLIERLIDLKPGWHISIDTLRYDVWRDCYVEKATIQKTVSNLRKRLRAAGLTGVVIDGAEPDRYSLKYVSENSA